MPINFIIREPKIKVIVMSDDFQPLKGTRDFLPEEKIKRQKILDVLVKTFEEFGFSPIETPAIETWEMATKKGSSESGTDVYKEIYRFRDQGERELTLRYELTFPLARLVAANPQIPKPFKRYQIGKVWRDGPVKSGRYREFWQCDVDTVGSESLITDAEFLAMYTKVFERLGLEVVIKVNDRRFLDGMLSFAGIDSDKRTDMMISLDKIEKIGEEGVFEEAIGRGIEREKVERVFYLLKNVKEIDNQKAKNSLQELEKMIGYAELMGAKDIEFVPSLTRGLSYYTGPVFEVFLKSGKLSSSLAGGGRWNNMISEFMNSEKNIPAVGTSFGLDTIYDALNLEGKIDKEKTVTDVFVIPIKTQRECISIVQELRALGVRADMDVMDRNISKNLSHANSLGIPYCIILGQRELEKSSVNLRDMNTGRETLISFEDLKKEIKNLRNSS